MSELGIFGALRDALPGLRRRLAARSRALLLVTLALQCGNALAGAGQANIVGGENQIAAPSNSLPLPITVRNDATFPQDLRVAITFDSTSGAFLNTGGTTVDIANVGAGQTRTVTVTLGSTAGNVSLTSCAVDGQGACIGGTQDFTGAATATLQGLSFNRAVDPGDAFQVQVEALNGGTVPFSSIPVTFTVTGPATPATFTTTSNYMAPATLNLVIDANAPGGSIVTVTAERTDVSPRPPAVTYTYTVNDYQLTQVSPPDGTAAQAGSVVTLVADARFNGAAPDGKMASRTITWEIIQDPSGASRLPGGATTTTSMVGNPSPSQASIDLTIGGPNPTSGTIIVRATAFGPISGPGPSGNERSVEFVIDPFDLLALDSTSGDNQFAEPNQPFAQPLRLRTTRNGAGEAGALIDWSVSPAGGLVLSSTQTPTDANGFTQINVTAGSTGGTYTVFARRNDDPNTVFSFNLTVVDKRLIKPGTGSGDGQTGTPGQPLPQPLVAQATLNGSPEANVPVTWTVTGGDATITSSTSPTDNGGFSSAQVTFGPSAGPVTVQAVRTDVPSQVQNYTLTAVATRSLEKPTTGSGDGQSGPIGSTLPDPLVVIARNSGVVAPGVSVLWTVVGGNATLSSRQTTTGADGSTSVRVTFGNTPGTVTIRATRADDSNASSTFVLTATSTVAPDLLLEKPDGSGDGTSATVGSGVTLTARAVIGTSPQAGIEVLWELVSGSARIESPRGFSDNMGLVSTRVTLGPNAGSVTVRAVRADSGASQTYRLTATGVVTDATLQVLDGNNQTGQPGTAARPLQVRYSSGGQAIANATVTWQVINGSATLTASSSLTNADGVAEVGLQFGNTPGEVQVRATAGTATAIFTLRVGTPGAMLQLISGNRQTGAVGTRAAAPIVVEVSDGLGGLLSNQSIQWTVLSGSATLDNATTSTGTDGRSSQGFRFGNSAGPIRIRAQLPGLQPPVFVEIEATSFVPTLSIVSGNNQSAAPGATLPQDLVVAIGGPAGASLAGTTIRWQVTSGGGTLVSATSVTGTDGRASNRLTLGSSSAQQSVTASIEGGPSVTFNASVTATPGALTLFSGNNQTLPTRTDSAPLVVELRNSAGVVIRGASLLWTGDNVQLRSVRTTTDENGLSSNVAQILLPGTARVTVVLEGGSGVSGTPVVFSLTGGVANIPQLGTLEETIGGAIDNLCPALVALANPTPEQLDLRARCLELVNNAGTNPDQVEVALDELREDVALAQANAALITAATQFDNLKTRIAALRSGSRGADLGGLAIANSSGVMPLSFLPSAVVQSEGESEGGSEAEAEVGSDFSRWGFFASGIIGRGEQDAGQVTPEYDFDTTGITAGVDYRVNDQWIVGASLGFNRQDTQLSGDSGGIDTDGWSVSGYTTWYRENNWYLDGVLTFGSNDYDLSRRIAYDIVGATGALTRVNQLAEASTSGDTLSTALSFGRDFNKGAWNFGPYLRATYTRVEFDAYEEELADGIGSGLGLAVESRALKSMTGVLGGKVTYTLSRDWGILMPHAQLEWEHEFKDDPQRVVTRFLHDPTGTRVGLSGDDLDTDYYNIGFGLSALFPGGRSAFFYYERLAGSEGLSQDNLSIGVRIEF